MTTSATSSDIPAALVPQQTLSRRSLLKLGVGTAAAVAVGGIINAVVLPNRPTRRYQTSDGTFPFAVPGLGYSKAALEPTISATTMTLHHDRHHQGYVDSLNAALQNYPRYHNMTLVELLTQQETLPQELQTAVRHHGGGHYNHTLFWQWLAPAGARKPEGDVANAIDEAFGGMRGLKKEVLAKASKHFGPGWVWVVVNTRGSLEVVTTSEQDTPLAMGKPPIVGIDLWEHAYYLDYQNKRDDYLEAIWDIINWDVVGARYEDALFLLGELGSARALQSIAHEHTLQNQGTHTVPVPSTSSGPHHP